MGRRGRRVLILFACVLSLAGTSRPAAGLEFETAARAAILVDIDTDTVLFEKAADEPIAPASMAKLMTVELVFEALERGDITFDTTFPISVDAWRRGGAPSRTSTMFAEVNSQVSVANLLRGAIIQSANDACIALAEGLAGSEPAFAERMTARARALGMENTVFTNATGLPDPGTHTTARDLATLAAHIIRTYPEYYRIFSEPDFTWNKIFQRSRNPLLGGPLGVDGLITGATEEAGYGIAASGVRDGRRLLLVVHGLKSAAQREREASRLLEWGYANFGVVRIARAGEPIATVSVYGGTEPTVPVAGREDIAVTVAHRERDQIRLRVTYVGPLEAPVAADTEVGRLQVYNAGQLINERPVYTTRGVARGDLATRAGDALYELLFGWLAARL